MIKYRSLFEMSPMRTSRATLPRASSNIVRISNYTNFFRTSRALFGRPMFRCNARLKQVDPGHYNRSLDMREHSRVQAIHVRALPPGQPQPACSDSYMHRRRRNSHPYLETIRGGNCIQNIPLSRSPTSTDRLQVDRNPSRKIKSNHIPNHARP